MARRSGSNGHHAVSSEQREVFLEVFRLGMHAFEDPNPPIQRMGLVLIGRAASFLEGARAPDMTESQFDVASQIARRVKEANLADDPQALEDLRQQIKGS